MKKLLTWEDLSMRRRVKTFIKRHSIRYISISRVIKECLRIKQLIKKEEEEIALIVMMGCEMCMHKKGDSKTPKMYTHIAP